MRKKLPRFKSEKEEAEFWDTHDSTEYCHEFVTVRGPLLAAPRGPAIEVSMNNWRDLTRYAKRHRTTPERLVNRWLRVKLGAKLNSRRERKSA